MQERPRLVGNHRDVFAGINRAANHSQRRAVITGRGQRARVAMRQHGRAVRNQLAAKFSQRAIRFDVFVVDRLRLEDQSLFHLFNVMGLFLGFLKRGVHALDRPKQINGSRAGRSHDFAHEAEIVFKIRN